MKKDDDRRRIDSGRPIRLVYLDENDNLTLHSDAIDVLERIQGPVAVVSAFGPPRQGKSFILNQILGKSSGFPIASTHQSCTKGLWMWSEPLKRIALDGTEYDLLLFDTGGISGYDQTQGVQSVKMFTLAVLLSSMLIYNRVGLIDEAALDHLSLLTEMTKHIHLRASERNDLISGFEYFIPVFIWLLRDFYIDLAEDSTRIAPHDYLKHALRPMLDGRKDVSKNQIRESIRAVFPNQECFTLVRPLNNETDLQHLDQVSLDQFRPEFRSGLEDFMKFVNERTRPKQVGGSAVTGPLLATIAKKFLDVLNDSNIPTIPSPWQIHAIDAFVEADAHGSEAIKSMETKLHVACQVANARLEHVAEVLESLLSEYEVSIHGPTKWQKLSSFLQKSLQGPILLHAKKLIDQVSSEKSALLSRCCSDEDMIGLLNLEEKNRLLEERYSSSLEMLDSAKQESLEWERKYEGMLVGKEADKEQGNAKIAVVGLGVREEAAKIAPGAESLQLALKEAREWKDKYDILVNESNAALEKAAEKAREGEEALLAKFTDNLAEKDKEIKKMITKIEDSERRLTSLTSDLKAAELKIEKSDSESSALMLQIEELEREAREWKEKYITIVNESNAALEKETDQARQREEALIAKFTDSLAEKDDEIKKMVTKIEDSEQRLISLTSDSKAVEIATESSRLALKEAHEWKEKYDTIVNESNVALEKGAEQARQREEALKEKFTDCLAEKDSEIKEMLTKVENSEQRLTSLASDLKAAEIVAAAESSQLALKEAHQWKEKYDTIVNESNAALEKAAEQARQREEALKAKFTDSLAEKDKEFEKMATKIEDSERRLTILTSDLKAAELKIKNYDLESSALKLQIKELAEKHWLDEASDQSTMKKIMLLEEKYSSESKRFEEAQERFKVSEEEANTNKNVETAQTEGFNGQTVNMETMDTGKEDLAGESPSWQLDITRETPYFLKQELTPDNTEESSHFREPRTYSGNKRSRLEFSNPKLRKPKSSSAMQKCTTAESDSSFKVGEEVDEYQDVASSVDYTKLTVMKLRQELQERGFGWELQKLKQPRKKDILALYRTLVLKK
ncbi:Guanylate-binding family protein [Euphorbia peplus]|nr:Guanylate-binding family protein [Euphorbia peplus]